MRRLTLYARSRRIPAAAGAALLGVVALGALDRQLHDPAATLVVTALAAAIGAAVAGPGLAGPDVDLERTAAVAWPAWRTAHVVSAAVALVAALAAGRLLGDAFAGPGVVVRDTAGLVGLTALGAATVGAARSWMVPLAWVAPVAMGVTAADTWHLQLLTWMTQPAGNPTAVATAAALLAGGTVAYAATGSRR